MTGPSAGSSPPPNFRLPSTESQCLPGSGALPFGHWNNPDSPRSPAGFPSLQRLSLGIDAGSVGSAGAGQEIVAVEDAPAREAGEIVEDDGEGFARIVAFLEDLKVI